MSSPQTDTDHDRVGDHIAIAFTQSQYPVPYTDQSIPGSTPGHRLRRLGRQHQPDDILYNHLSHALIAHGDCSSHDAVNATPWEGNADHPHPPGGNYVLHSKNGGKRHYDELSGMYSELPWQPSKRMIWPLQEDERRLVPHRRGRGIYNNTDCFIHPDAEAAQKQREQDGERQRDRGCRAHVCGAPDHTLAELGMMYEQQQRKPKESTSVVRPSEGSAPSPSSSTVAVAAAATADGAPATPAKKDARTAAAAVVVEDGVRNKAYYGLTLLPSVGPGVPPPRSTVAEAEAVAEYHRDQHMRSTMHLQKETLSAKATRAADVQSVRELPNW
ncbi:hypothetical protein ABB37_07781 [Leptomonas pyrrhocoris]|uniref:Uncharacterized protein n=1 Tax=Leptomonas pyrrhocoris TaxID=157538 RepID=A0A0M9FUX8_LEPPY|nr:hypothetical protein ABB37_07781 [Leptomonas pyrrhocoris]XP_015654907.1 hypothetical protein ABB37_07781 [Leptomonas pyrrhocoris]KPA76467.1 hypothetical protein ABB37_07781 [Leptomonas pyrrhocoris]KPA76468.1 hypothetical protein ABB37_07781 [Leptomonas pyrrhocoris]|eukprot:XP_015654906.1 hypothetical protein ABB37_07781 [Leptomonas pyrrhocoris]